MSVSIDSANSTKRNVDDITKTSMIIPGLTPSLLARARGSRNACSSVPRFGNVQDTQGRTVFAFTVPGSSAGSAYNVQISNIAGKSIDSVKDLKVLCSCPDASSQLKGLVCKHAFACLEKLIDHQAEQAAKVKRERAAQDLHSLKTGPLGKEHQRITNGLSKLSDDLLKMLLDKANTEQGLQLLIQLFPCSELPSQTLKYCHRCQTKYDPYYDQECRIPHAVEDVERTNKTSRGSSYECGKCGRSWKDDSFGYYDACVTEESGACYQGPHQEEPEGNDDEEVGDDYDEDL